MRGRGRERGFQDFDNIFNLNCNAMHDGDGEEGTAGCILKPAFGTLCCSFKQNLLCRRMRK